jgi:circadian clock protein KaiC
MAPRLRSDALRSGHEPLDAVLGGGLPANGISMIMGLPGTGKTIIAQQYAFHNGRPDRPAVYFSTVSEPLEKIVRFGQTLDFFDVTAVGRSVFYQDLGGTVDRSGLAGVDEQIALVLKERQPGLIVIDSFKALRVFAEDDAGFRRFLYQLAGRLTAFPAACLWVGEYETADIALLPEFAVADAIVDLAAERRGYQREMRFLHVRKMRGGGFRSGRHAYRLSRAGIQVFPRLADSPAEGSYPLAGQRVSTGLADLDQMLDGGYWPGAATLVAGPTGSGKTLMGLHFVFGGARQGEPGVIATLQENPSQLELMLRGFGWAADDPAVEVMYRSPVDIYIDEWVADLMQIVERTRARRVLVDSLLNLQIAAPDETRFREFIYSLAQRFARQGVSMLMTYEVPELFGARSLSDFAMSHLCDNVITLRYYWEDGSVNRALTVLKTRASGHESSPRQYEVASHGIAIGDRAPTGDRPGRSWAS